MVSRQIQQSPLPRAVLVSRPHHYAIFPHCTCGWAICTQTVSYIFFYFVNYLYSYCDWLTDRFIMPLCTSRSQACVLYHQKAQQVPFGTQQYFLFSAVFVVQCCIFQKRCGVEIITLLFVWSSPMQVLKCNIIVLLCI